MKNYCLGFALSPKLDWVTLIHKLKPDWQRGFLNGVGGSIEDGEEPAFAMAREFKEETGVETTPYEWKVFCHIDSPGIHVFCFCMTSDKIMAVRSLTAEIVTLHRTQPIVTCFIDMAGPSDRNVLYNVPTLVSMAITHLAAEKFFPKDRYVYTLNESSPRT